MRIVYITTQPSKSEHFYNILTKYRSESNNLLKVIFETPFINYRIGESQCVAENINEHTHHIVGRTWRYEKREEHKLLFFLHVSN